ncbi:hypothetical protein PIB30_059068 [Stylosanthes scabra]|uniref:Uncharacterized protein n=1 Tax=Stylosanthes scabra TaxID=79078 RepID=A0ABU6SKG3_9FABA|nr:hypothetical protein [Stylosanthes scabra]
MEIELKRIRRLKEKFRMIHEQFIILPFEEAVSLLVPSMRITLTAFAIPHLRKAVKSFRLRLYDPSHTRFDRGANAGMTDLQ